MKEETGLILDIDDTLANTVHHAVSFLNKRYPNPEHLGVDELVRKYHIVPKMPFWQTPEIVEWLEKLSNSDEFVGSIPVVTEASEAVTEICTLIPVKLYITSRPSKVEEVTKNWLNKSGFPPAPIVTRPDEMKHVDGNIWKADILKRLYPYRAHIVDDNPDIVSALGDMYPGVVYLLNQDTHKEVVGARFVHCKSWAEIKQEMLKNFSEQSSTVL